MQTTLAQNPRENTKFMIQKANPITVSQTSRSLLNQ